VKFLIFLVKNACLYFSYSSKEKKLHLLNLFTMSSEEESFEHLKEELRKAKLKIAALELANTNYSFYKHLFMASRDLACIAGTDGFFKMVNPAFESVLGYSQTELVSQQFLVFVHPDDYENTVQEIEKLRSGETIINFENRYHTKSGSYVDLQWMAIPDQSSGTIYAIARDVTEKKRESSKISESEKLLRDAQKMAHLGSFEFTFENEELIWSEELYNIFELDVDPTKVLYYRFQERLRESDIDLLKNKIGMAVQTGEPYEIEHSVFFEDGREKVVYASALPIKDDSGRVIKLRGIVQDITQKKRVEEAILNSVREKETLIKEIHHRVKNNLQVISSLLNLQANIISDDQLKRLYADSQNRIKAMASIHELLYKSDNFSKINYAQYIHRLVQDLLFSLHGEKHDIEIDLDMPPQLLDLDTAVPLGLMVNEIITNSLKHGIQKTNSGRIYLKMIPLEDGVFEMRIGDSGRGFNFSEKMAEGDTLGLMLIESLALQLGGTIHYNAEMMGSNYILRFKYVDQSENRLHSIAQEKL
jgi:PAS domain S-box-containing protein